jgi:exopolysaccharide biosynthesis polyprenyl glycosylphosphotransferase
MMLKDHRRELSSIYRFLDFAIIVIAVNAVFYIYYNTTILDFAALPFQCQIFLAVNILAWIYFSNRFRLYTSRRMIKLWRETFDVIKTVTVCVFMATIAAFIFDRNVLERLFVFDILIIEICLLLIFRYCLKSFLKYIRSHGYDYRQILIFGRNERSLQILKEIEHSPYLGIRVVGFVDAYIEYRNYHSDFAKYPFFGDIKNLEMILRKNVVDEVFVFLPIKSFYQEIEDIISICEIVGIEVKIPTDIFSMQLSKSTISFYGNISVIDLFISPKMNWHLLIKRMIDVAVSLTGLIILLPFFIIIMFLIKEASHGPAFFKQQRVGYNGRLFNCFKFRTMVADAELLKDDLMKYNEMDWPVFKIKADPRITKIGQFLRKTSIDELPQLLNVLLGDMSLVGPRPPVPEEVKHYDLPSLRRLRMKPGITGIWQVSGRNSIPFEKWMELDREYIDNWSLALDFKILLKTIPAVLKGSGV